MLPRSVDPVRLSVVRGCAGCPAQGVVIDNMRQRGGSHDGIIADICTRRSVASVNVIQLGCVGMNPQNTQSFVRSSQAFDCGKRGKMVRKHHARDDSTRWTTVRSTD